MNTRNLFIFLGVSLLNSSFHGSSYAEDLVDAHSDKNRSPISCKSDATGALYIVTRGVHIQQ